LSNPAKCDFNPSEIQCKPGGSTNECLTPSQVETLEKIYKGTRNPRTGALIYPLWVKSSEQALFHLFGSEQSETSRGGADGILRWVFGARWDASTFDFDRDVVTVDQTVGSRVNALSPDLRRFVAHGGKLIMYHGWEDGIVSPFDSIIYYNEITGARADTSDTQHSDFVRLFMVPGMGHCGHGPGPNSFGQPPSGRLDLSVPNDAEHDVLAALDRWVEKGAVPDQIIATKYKEGDSNSAAIATRPLCPYPKVVQYSGTGSATAAENFECVESTPPRFEMPVKDYLQ
jgi:hypothetical protein